MHGAYFIVSLWGFHKRAVCFLHVLCILHHLLLIGIHVVLRILRHQLLLVMIRLFVNIHHAARGVGVHSQLLVSHSLHVLKFLSALGTSSIPNGHNRRTIISSYIRHVVRPSSFIVVRIVRVVLRNKSWSASVWITNKKGWLLLVRGALSWHIESVVMVLMRWKSCRIPLWLLSRIIVKLFLSTWIMRCFSRLLSHSEISLDLLVLHGLSLG